jgi:hypothetical protein
MKVHHAIKFQTRLQQFATILNVSFSEHLPYHGLFLN